VTSFMTGVKLAMQATVPLYLASGAMSGSAVADRGEKARGAALGALGGGLAHVATDRALRALPPKTFQRLASKIHGLPAMKRHAVASALIPAPPYLGGTMAARLGRKRERRER
jgi:hypothetical protein